MDPGRLLLRVLFRVERLLDSVSALLSAIYIAVVVSLVSLTAYIYLVDLRPLIALALAPPHAALHTAVSLYLLFSVVANYVRCLCTSPGSPPRAADPEGAPVAKSADDKHPPDSTRTRSETWRFCAVCRAPKPPRAHHCTACNACYYKLCHHCPALGKCVGRDNYPFFFRFVIASWWGALFAAATCACLRRDASAARPDDMLFFMTIGGCAVGVAVGVLGSWHMYLLLTGQTTIEWLENLQMRRRGMAPDEWGKWGGPFSKGVRLNVREAFGELPCRFVPWWAVFFIPVRRVAVWDPD